jgi:hypothetical protein
VTRTGRFSSEPVIPYIVPGDHFTMMTEPPHVQVLGQQLATCLLRAGLSPGMAIAMHGSVEAG